MTWIHVVQRPVWRWRLWLVKREHLSKIQSVQDQNLSLLSKTETTHSCCIQQLFVCINRGFPHSSSWLYKLHRSTVNRCDIFSLWSFYNMPIMNVCHNEVRNCFVIWMHMHCFKFSKTNIKKKSLSCQKNMNIGFLHLCSLFHQ